MENINAINVNNKDGFYITVNLPSTQAQTSGNYGAFFTAYHTCEILQITEIHSVAGTDASDVTLDIEKLTGTTALGSGLSVLSSEFNLKSTANTVVRKRRLELSKNRGMAVGDRLALKVTGTLTSLSGVQVTLYLKHKGKGDYA